MKSKSRIAGLFILILMISFLFSCNKEDPSQPIAIDIEGNVYKTIIIGTQTWMAENLKTTKYRNVDPIPNATDQTEWNALRTGAFCNYDNLIYRAETYGRLYNNFAVSDSRNIAPVGWHVPSVEEWQILIDFCGGNDIASDVLKEAGLTHWNAPNPYDTQAIQMTPRGATNESGFTALPGGMRSNEFEYLNMNGVWWTTEVDYLAYEVKAVIISSNFSYRNVFKGSIPLRYGVSIRCIQDN